MYVGVRSWVTTANSNIATHLRAARTIMKLRGAPVHLYPCDDHPQGVGDECHESAREGGGPEADHALVEGVSDVVGGGQRADGVLVDGPVEQRREQSDEDEEDEAVVGLDNHRGRASGGGEEVVAVSAGGDDGLKTHGGDQGRVGEHEAEAVRDHGEETTQQPARGGGGGEGGGRAGIGQEEEIRGKSRLDRA